MHWHYRPHLINQSYCILVEETACERTSRRHRLLRIPTRMLCTTFTKRGRLTKHTKQQPVLTTSHPSNLSTTLIGTAPRQCLVPYSGRQRVWRFQLWFLLARLQHKGSMVLELAHSQSRSYSVNHHLNDQNAFSGTETRLLRCLGTEAWLHL